MRCKPLYLGRACTGRACAAAFLALYWGCGSSQGPQATPSAGAAPPAEPDAGPSAAAPDDAALERMIAEALLFDTEVRATGVTIRVDRGVAYLRGSVDHLLAKERAKRIVAGIDGIVRVIDQLTFPPPRPSAALRHAVERALRFDPSIDPDDIDIQMAGAEVTLTGSVPTPGLRRQAGTAVERVRGVRAVHNELRVTGRTNAGRRDRDAGM